MLARDEIIEIVQHTVAEVAGVYETDVTLDSQLQHDLGLEPDDCEEIAAHLQGSLESHIAPDDLFPDGSTDEMTVHSLVNALEEKFGAI